MTSIHERVMNAVEVTGSTGATTDELVQKLNCPRSTVSARVRELVQFGRLVSDGTRATRGAPAARVYKLPVKVKKAKMAKPKPKKTATATKKRGDPNPADEVKTCGRCKKPRRRHATFFVKVLGKRRAMPWCRECESKRRKNATPWRNKGAK